MSIKGLDATAPASDGVAGQGDDELRALKAALQACFGGPTGSGLDGAVTNDATATFPTATEWSALFSRLTAIEAGSGTGLVVGEIKAWYGDVANLPSGWYVADGTNGTQNLQGRMLIGDNQTIGAQTGNPTYESATTGGATPGSQTTDAGGAISEDLSSVIGGHTLVVDNLPEHSHFIAYDNSTGTSSGGGATNTKGIKANWANSSGDGYVLKETDGTFAAEAPNVGKTSETGGSGTPDAVAHTGTLTVAAHTHGLGAGSLPPWHSIYWIQYTGA